VTIIYFFKKFGVANFVIKL